MTTQVLQVGGVVLCGGQSRRMGVAKAELPFGDQTMLQRVVGRLAEVVEPIVVVCAADQHPPKLDSPVLFTHDQQEDRGPLEGIRAGLSALPTSVDAAYVTSCDVPLLQGAFVRKLIDRLVAPGADFDVIVPVDGEFHHPLAAVYRRRLLPRIEQLLAAGRLRPVFLFEESVTCRVNVEELRKVDRDLSTLANLNRPEDYLAALKQEGLAAPSEVLRKLNL